MEESGCSGILGNLDSVISEEEEAYIGTLVSRENSFEGRNSRGFSSSDASSAVPAVDWLKYARSAAVRWILRVGVPHSRLRGYFGFSPQTAYLSVIYLDRFFVKRTIDRQSWAIQLLSVACLSLAAKMEECRVPALTEYPGEECEFESKAIQRMELLVLNTLEWRMGSITPFLYIDYFASKFVLCRSGKGLPSRATELILAAIEGMNLVDHRPSAVAAAAVFAAAGQPLTKTLLEDKIGAVSPCRSLETDRTLSCYNLIMMMIQESRKSQKDLPLHNLLIPFEATPASFPCVPCSGDVIDSSSLSTVCSKRRRLTLSSYDCNCPTSRKNNPD
ncbi:unnamed protein product [Spirodela intermedia]|uniref:Cyclin-like domain-containing protein n=1 Tax=Spirodela intermedia TaxID=51605 RepID=A0A7I8II94_SPIIN|nr:unnamed protein product [Spirodela intermedia]CAA6657524.1 unnamed protein product [Spirodela intermedia]